MSQQLLVEALEHLVQGIVDHPEQAGVSARESQRGTVLEVRVDPRDLGRVIGRHGRTATALRTLVSALADGERVRVDVVDTDDGHQGSGRFAESGTTESA